MTTNKQRWWRSSRDTAGVIYILSILPVSIWHWVAGSLHVLIFLLFVSPVFIWVAFGLRTIYRDLWLGEGEPQPRKQTWTENVLETLLLHLFMFGYFVGHLFGYIEFGLTGSLVVGACGFLVGVPIFYMNNLVKEAFDDLTL